MPTPLNILFIVPYVPDLIRVRPYNLIRYLARREHCITVLAPWTTEEEYNSMQELETICERVDGVRLPKMLSYWNCLTALPTKIPLQSVYCWHPALVRKAMALLAENNGKKIDLVHVEHLRGARYGLKLKSSISNSCVPVVWDSVDSITYLFRQAAGQSQKRLSRLITGFELSRTEWYEGYLVNQFDRVLVTSKTDKAALDKLGHLDPSSGKVVVLNNGVDLSYFTPAPEIKREPGTLVVSGKLSYHANVSMVLHLVKNIMPLVWEKRPDVKLYVVGKNPPREIQELKENPAIVVTDTVRDIRPYLQRATAAVAPVTYGAGIQNKVLEAMACATPVISTSKAVSALNVLPGRDVLVADAPDQFAHLVLELLSRPEMQMAIGGAGRRYVETHHSWNGIAEKLEEVYLEEITKKRGKCL